MEGKGNTRLWPNPFIPSFLASDADFLIIMILDNLTKNQVNLMSIFLSWVSGDGKRKHGTLNMGNPAGFF